MIAMEVNGDAEIQPYSSSCKPAPELAPELPGSVCQCLSCHVVLSELEGAPIDANVLILGVFEQGGSSCQGTGRRFEAVSPLHLSTFIDKRPLAGRAGMRCVSRLARPQDSGEASHV